MSNFIKIVLFIALIFFVICVGPWLMIWAVNTLIAAGGVANFFIPFTFWTWLAALVFMALVRGSSKG
jgi:hypothetical protein